MKIVVRCKPKKIYKFIGSFLNNFIQHNPIEITKSKRKSILYSLYNLSRRRGR